MLTIFDADNVVDERFFAEVNSQYLDQGKPAAIQGYLGCKNKSGLVAFFYYHSYTLTNRFFQLTRYRLGINCSVGGTGLAFSLKALARVGGWRANTLTEDMEMQLLFTRNGERILWNHYAKIYDEKPTNAATAFKQRTRWSQGHWYVSLQNAGPLIAAFFRRRIPLKELISSFFYMFSIPMSIQVPLVALMAVVAIAVEKFQPLVFLGLHDWSWVRNGLLFLMFLYTLFGLFFVADYKDNQEKPRISALLMVVASYITLYPLTMASQIVGFFRHRDQRVWAKTDHAITVPAETGREEAPERERNVV